MMSIWPYIKAEISVLPQQYTLLGIKALSSFCNGLVILIYIFHGTDVHISHVSLNIFSAHNILDTANICISFNSIWLTILRYMILSNNLIILKYLMIVIYFVVLTYFIITNYLLI